jgi:hypothetical protein
VSFGICAAGGNKKMAQLRLTGRQGTSLVPSKTAFQNPPAVAVLDDLGGVNPRVKIEAEKSPTVVIECLAFRRVIQRGGTANRR